MGRRAKNPKGVLQRITPPWRKLALERIQERHASQAAFARYIGCAPPRLNEILRSESRQSSHWVEVIADALDLPLPALEMSEDEIRLLMALRDIRRADFSAYKAQVAKIERFAKAIQKRRNDEI